MRASAHAATKRVCFWDDDVKNEDKDLVVLDVSGRSEKIKAALREVTECEEMTDDQVSLRL